MFSEKLIHIIKEKRPLLKDSSIDLYISNMKILSKSLDVPFENVNFLLNKKNVDEALVLKSPATVKTYYASIVVVLKALEFNEDIIKEYSDSMDTLSETNQSFLETQEKNKKQDDNWMEYKELIKVMNYLRKQVSSLKLLKKPVESLTNKEFMLIQKWVVASLYLISPDTNPPIRLGYAPMKIISHKDWLKSIDDGEKPKENYLVIVNRNNKKFVFNNYKTQSTYNERIITVGKLLNNVLNKWLKINTTDYLLLTIKKVPMNSNGLTKFIQNIFDYTNKRVSVSMIRHAYLTDRYMADNVDKKAIAELMLHSQSTQIEYIKKNN